VDVAAAAGRVEPALGALGGGEALRHPQPAAVRPSRIDTPSRSSVRRIMGMILPQPDRAMCGISRVAAGRSPWGLAPPGATMAGVRGRGRGPRNHKWLFCGDLRTVPGEADGRLVWFGHLWFWDGDKKKAKSEGFFVDAEAWIGH